MISWETDWENPEVDLQDPKIAEMFVRALGERSFQFTDPTPYDPYVSDFWLDMVNSCHQLGFSTYTTDEFDNGVPKTWHEAGKWPPPNGFRRRFPCTINTLTDPVKPGKIARFEYVIPTTPLNQKKYSGRLFEVVDDKWVLSETAKMPSVLEDFGLPKIGDYLHGHILNDCKQCINLAGIYRTSVDFSSKFEKNLKWGHGSATLFSGMSNAEIKTSLEFAEQQALNLSAPQSADNSNPETGFTANPLDPSLRVFELSVNNKHGTARLERIDKDHVRFWGVDSKTPSAPTKLSIVPADLAFDVNNATTITDGEGKSIKVLRTFEPFNEAILQVLKTYHDAVVTVQGGTAIATATIDEVEVIGTAEEGISLSTTNLVTSTGILLAQVRRTTLGEIREDSYFNCFFDILASSITFPTSASFSTSVTISILPPVALAFRGLSIITDNRGGIPGFVSAWITGQIRVYGYPFVRSFYDKILKRKVSFYISYPFLNVSEFSNNGDHIPAPATVYYKHGLPIESDTLEVMGEKLGRLETMPLPWPTYSGGVISASRGYTGTATWAMLNFLIEGGFKYKQGYNGA